MSDQSKPVGRNHGPNYFAAVELRGQGLSQEQIARRLGISLSRVRKILKANGLTGSGVPRRQAK